MAQIRHRLSDSDFRRQISGKCRKRNSVFERNRLPFWRNGVELKIIRRSKRQFASSSSSSSSNILERSLMRLMTAVSTSTVTARIMLWMLLLLLLLFISGGR